jgi:hypothetical protein
MSVSLITPMLANLFLLNINVFVNSCNFFTFVNNFSNKLDLKLTSSFFVHQPLNGRKKFVRSFFKIPSEPFFSNKAFLH